MARPALVVALGASLYAIAANTGAGWLYVVASAVGAVVLISAVAPLWSVRGIRLARKAPATGVAGSPLTCELEVGSSGRLARHLIELEDHYAGGTGRSVVVRAPRGSSRVEYRIRNPARGIYEGGEVLIESGAPFGLFFGRRRVRVPQGKTVVYPGTFDIHVLPEPNVSLREGEGPDEPDPRKGEDGGFWGVREYRPGDPQRMVAWRRSARSLAGGAGSLTVLETTQHSQPPLRMTLDVSEQTPPQAREMVISSGASLMLAALREGRRVVADAGSGAAPSPEDAGAEELLTWCAGLAPGQPPRAGDSDLAVVSSLRRTPVPGAGTIVLVTRDALAGESPGPWMTLEEERLWISGAEAAGRRVVRLGAEVREQRRPA